MKYTLEKFKATDVFTMASLLSKIGLGKIADGLGKDNILKLIESVKEKNSENVATITGMQLFLQVGEIILANLDVCETELFKLLSSTTKAPIDELKGLDADEFIELIVEVAKMEQFKDFFKRASGLLNTVK